MPDLKLDVSKLAPFISQHEIDFMQSEVNQAHSLLRSGKGPGHEFTDWLDLPFDYDKEEYERIKAAAKKIQGDSDVLLVLGIGGSYLGAKAAISFLSHQFIKEEKLEIIFAGNSLSATYLSEVMEALEGKDFSINVISKSGTTTETSIAFRIFKKRLIDQYGEEEAKRRIYATTDQAKGALKAEADQMGYETFVIPDGVGGRFTVLTAVGLLPIAASGANTDDLLAGAQASHQAYQAPELEKNDAYLYAAIRNILYRKGYNTEILVNYEPKLKYFAEWWKQLFGESEGKDGKGIYPSSANFSTDLHSLGQYIQDGRRILFETVIKVEETEKDIKIPSLAEDSDGLGYLEGQSVDEVNTKAFQGTLLAHTDGGVPNLVLHAPAIDAYTLGQLIYFFEIAVAISGYLNGVNPFDQPGVEAYKKNMFALLGREGYEELAQALNERL
ncbi:MULTISPECIES: glucose-6-phosphate isomerase [Aerococcus]|uniref:Glucose-6-phosphate isomerase n=1 Tax=Aerococcus sanguinicola TaxID=119206 RepID=A0A5N1GKV4_9LACT|nr:MULTISPECIES: glucose-6-phosphate isomerase [Aerococcus]KAA9300946.1 glucose-6-phosphate isomerase [Aerococcus sanguinicola]MDK6369179.1 glucose-6-phosphate isomerase [Aerococcus sp. UMB9870]MDK6679761.1 glucose-6-phosphate isomerase [Aerococcus sp. UMB8608]MDK6686672.1 glucose-6-phosphate isomerase [Aerococcus sp. UMB8623]MDK6939683.1 glucose-6-phosphate isomerase [Aerococcus sp. UMB8487]